MNTFDPQQNRRVLVIDDNHAIHDDFRKILGVGPEADRAMDDAEAALFGEPKAASHRVTFEVDSAMQGREGLERARQALEEGRPYSMAFIDVRMPPGWDGVETIAQIWAIYPDLQVVMCTAYSDYSWDEMLAKVGQSDRLVILKKPFDNVEVLQLANALTAKWQLVQQNRSQVQELETRVRERTQEIEAAHAKLHAELNDRNRMEVQLRHAQKMESIGQLAAGIAHEINTPTQYIGDNMRFLTGAFGDLKTVLQHQDQLRRALQDGTLNDALVAEVEKAAQDLDLAYLEAEIPKALQQSLDGVERVAKIVRAMKEFSHPGTDEKILVDINHGIECTLTVCRNEWKYVAEMVCEFDPGLPLVPCLPGEINQTILNLVVNAAHAIADVVGDASGGRGRITVSTLRAGDWAEIRVRDTGTGIPESARGRVFDPFYTPKGVGKGTGQGLAIAHAVVVEKHGGTITFETEVGQGTTFILRLPLKAATPAKEAA